MEPEFNHFQEIKLLAHQGMTFDEIRNFLAEKGFEMEHINALIDKLHLSHKYKKQRKLGFNLLVAGALVCLTSCLLTFFHDYSAVYAAVSLYGLTFVGACLLLAGLALVLGI